MAQKHTPGVLILLSILAMFPQAYGFSTSSEVTLENCFSNFTHHPDLDPYDLFKEDGLKKVTPTWHYELLQLGRAVHDDFKNLKTFFGISEIQGVSIDRLAQSALETPIMVCKSVVVKNSANTYRFSGTHLRSIQGKFAVAIQESIIDSTPEQNLSALYQHEILRLHHIDDDMLSYTAILQALKVHPTIEKFSLEDGTKLLSTSPPRHIKLLALVRSYIQNDQRPLFTCSGCGGSAGGASSGGRGGDGRLISAKVAIFQDILSWLDKALYEGKSISPAHFAQIMDSFFRLEMKLSNPESLIKWSYNQNEVIVPIAKLEPEELVQYRYRRFEFTKGLVLNENSTP